MGRFRVVVTIPALVLCSGVAHGQAAPGSAHSSEPDEPASDPPAPVRLRQKLTDCLGLAEQSPERNQCYAEAASLIREGLRFQRCLWNVGDVQGRGFCPQSAAAESLDQVPDPKSQKLLLEKGEALARELDAVGQGTPEQSGLIQSQARELLVAVGDTVGARQGTYTLVSQGGVSLGNWQAGYAYMATELLKARQLAHYTQPRAIFRTVTGTSAGAVNALAYGLEGCSREFHAPEDTLAYRIWVDSLQLFPSHGHPGLLDEEPAHPLALFDDAPLRRAIDEADRAISKTAASSNCRFDLGFVVTHLTHASSPVHVKQVAQGKIEQSLSVPRASERFALQVDLANRLATFRNLYEAKSSDGLQHLLVPDETFYPRLGAGMQPLRQDVLAGIQASGAFPIAFPPVELTYQAYNPLAGKYEVQRSTFVDGGVLENSPVGLAIEINKTKQLNSANPWFADLFGGSDTYVFVSPSAVEWEIERNRASAGTVAPDNTLKHPRLIPTYLHWAANIAATGAEARFAQTAEANPFMRQEMAGHAGPPRILVPIRQLPITGDQLAHFFAFAEREFRVFDYVVGMVEARLYAAEIDADDADGQAVANALQKTSGRDGIGARFACLSKFYDEHVHKDSRSICQARFPGDEIKLKRCQEEPKLPTICESAPPAFRQLTLVNWRYKLWLQDPTQFDESKAFDHYLQLLHDAHFEFRDVPEPHRTALSTGDGALFTRRLADVAIRRLSENENWITRRLMRLGGQIVADASIARLFPLWPVSIGYPERGLEVGLGRTLFAPSQWYGLRADLRGRVFDWRSHVVGSESFRDFRASMINTDLTLGLTHIVPPATLGWADLEFGLGGVLTYRWAPAQEGRRVVFRRFGLYGSLAFVLSQRLYFMLEYQRFFNTDVMGVYAHTTEVPDADHRTAISLGVRLF